MRAQRSQKFRVLRAVDEVGRIARESEANGAIMTFFTTLFFIYVFLPSESLGRPTKVDRATSILLCERV